MSDSNTGSSVNFESAVLSAFAFLETDKDMEFRGVREVDEGGRDYCLVARFRSDSARVDVGWSEPELSVAVLIYLDRSELSRRDRYIYMEPFVEFLTGDSDSIIVPQIYLGMSESRIEIAMEQRKRLFESQSLTEVLEDISSKLQRYFCSIIHAADDQILKYQEWWASAQSRASRGS